MSNRKLKIFTYGTLMQGQKNHAWFDKDCANGKFVQKDSIIADMRTSNHVFPYITNIGHSKTTVIGEIYEIPENKLGYLDTLEGYKPGKIDDCLYIRRVITTTSGNEGIVYEAGKELLKYNYVEISGDWIKYKTEFDNRLALQ